MDETLCRLAKCYERNFNNKLCWKDDGQGTALERAFCRNNDWFRFFKNINGYIDFWDLNFVAEDIESMISAKF